MRSREISFSADCPEGPMVKRCPTCSSTISTCVCKILQRKDALLCFVHLLPTWHSQFDGNSGCTKNMCKFAWGWVVGRTLNLIVSSLTLAKWISQTWGEGETRWKEVKWNWCAGVAPAFVFGWNCFAPRCKEVLVWFKPSFGHSEGFQNHCYWHNALACEKPACRSCWSCCTCSCGSKNTHNNACLNLNVCNVWIWSRHCLILASCLW